MECEHEIESHDQHITLTPSAKWTKKQEKQKIEDSRDDGREKINK